MRQKQAAEKMLNFSTTAFPPLRIGETVTVAVPSVDQGPLDFPSIYGLIINVKNDSYQIGTNEGLITGWFPRTDLTRVDATVDSIKDVPMDKSITLREAAQYQSLLGGQGYSKCNCKALAKQCQTNRCSCYKNTMKCNSRCHSSSNCLNKHDEK